MTVPASEIIEGVRELVRDAPLSDGSDYRVFKTAQAVRWINDGQRGICGLRPDALAIVTPHQLTTGKTLQQVPAGYHRLLGLNINLGADGETVGQAITGPVPQEHLDSVQPGWRTSTGTRVRQYVWHPDTPLYFYVVPSVAVTHYVEARLAKEPTAISALTENIELPDTFAPALMAWVASRALSRDDENSPNWVRAGELMAQSLQLLGVEGQARAATNPRSNERG